MRSIRKSRPRGLWEKYNPHAVTIFGIHVIELGQTAIFHAADWGGLHTAMAVGLAATLAQTIKAK